MDLQANVWYKRHRLNDTKSGMLHALEIFEKLRIVKDVEGCRDPPQVIEKAKENWPTSSKGEVLETTLHPPIH